MKINTLLLSTLLSVAHAQSAFAQGSLTPPAGPPGPVMKTLDQIEARIPLVAGAPGVSINAGTGTITVAQPGSYYLTGNLTVSSNGIVLNTSDVTLDLNGFTVRSTEADNTGTGVLIGNARRNIIIQNGHIRGSVAKTGTTYAGAGFANGIYFVTNPPVNVLVKNINVAGCTMWGIGLERGIITSSSVQSCTVTVVGNAGITASMVKDSVATDTGTTAIVADLVEGCIGRASGYGGLTPSGINANIVSNSQGVAPGYGIVAAHTVSNSYGESNGSLSGIDCAGTVSFSRGKSASGFAIVAPVCIGSTSAGGTISSVQKHLGTP